MENRVLKVLNVNMSLDPVKGGGTVERTFQMSRFLAKAGIDCSILTTDLGLTNERSEALEGVSITALPCVLGRFYIPKFSYKQVRGIIENVDIVHIMGHWILLNALVYFVSRRLRTPYVVCPAGHLPIYGRSKILKKLYNWMVGKKIIFNALGHIAITADEKLQYQSYGVDAKNVTIIPNGIDFEDFLASDNAGFREKYGLGNCPMILFVGRLNHIKGPDLLLRAFCNVKDILKPYHLVFVGPDGGMLGELKKVAAEYGVEDRVHFIGYLGGEDKSIAYHAADLLVIPSRQEAMSIVVLESGVSGTPVLLTDKCGFNEISGINGGKVVPATVDGLKSGLLDILGTPFKLKEMGENLKGFVVKHYTWDSIVKKYIQFYDKLLTS